MFVQSENSPTVSFY